MGANPPAEIVRPRPYELTISGSVEKKVDCRMKSFADLSEARAAFYTAMRELRLGQGPDCYSLELIDRQCVPPRRVYYVTLGCREFTLRASHA